jgi:2-iminobutanoate/2-iminopropanoate deaminase
VTTETHGRVTGVRVGNALDLEGYPIAPATRCGDRVETAGVIAIDPNSGELVVGEVAEQTRVTLDNLTQILHAAGCTLADIMFVDVVLADVRRDFAEFNAVYTDWIGSLLPARRTVGGELALDGLLVEIRAVAICSEGS